MTVKDIIRLTKLHTRDTQSIMFDDAMILDFLNEGIDRIRGYKYLADTPHVSELNDEIQVIPDQYQYALGLWCASRCFDYDERWYEGSEKRNEFENIFAEMTSAIDIGDVTISDSYGDEIDTSDGINELDIVRNVYFD